MRSNGLGGLRAVARNDLGSVQMDQKLFNRLPNGQWSGRLTKVQKWSGRLPSGHKRPQSLAS